MKDSYYDVEHRATVCTFYIGHLMGHDTYLVSRVEVGREHRGKGVAGRLLQQAIDDADDEGVQLALVVEPDGSIDSLDYDALVEFYERRGFEPYDYGNGLLRQPKVDACLNT